MKAQFFFMFSAGTLLLCAQPMARRADIRGGGDRGKCTIEVVVDGAAEVEIRGDTAVLRNLQGRPPEWRRFVCNSPMPPNPVEFRFAGIDGRGRQQLVRDPRGGGPAVVRIEDPQNGSEGYTFDVMWAYASYRPPVEDRDDWRRERDDWARRENWRERLFDRVRMDIEQVERVSWPRGGDEYRLERTKQELNELQGQMARGRYDDRELDDVIRALDRVVDDNHLSPRDREILRDDLHRLRELRERR